MPDADHQELRIAPVMTGGTSLAVWMGGVAAELFAVVSARPSEGPDAHAPSDRPTSYGLYARLLDFTRTRARVDVLTGTSAGGLNGTLLAAAWRYQLTPEQFSSIRSTWLDIADLKALLRPASMTNPPSLLKGDAYFRKRVEERLEDFRHRGTPAPSDLRPLDLLITVTTVTPEPVKREDDFGEVLAEVNYAHRLRFSADDIAELGGAGERWPRMLAVASRTSACIPGVFEPSFLPIGDKDATASGLPDFAGHASFTTSKYAVDGGVVNNLPLGEALDRIFFLPSARDVRRVVLYVSPTPSTAGGSTPAPIDPAPTLRESLVTLVSGPRAEGVAADVDRIRRHNDSVAAQVRARLAVVKIAGTADALTDAADRLMTEYRDRRTEMSVTTTLDAVMKVREWSEIDRRMVAAALRGARTRLVPAQIGTLDSAGNKQQWSWGIAPVEHAVSMVASLIRRALSLARPGDASADALRTRRAELDPVFVSLGQIRDQDRRYWSQRILLLPSATTTGRIDALADWAAAAYAEWPDCATPAPGDRTRDEAFALLRAAFDTAAAVLVAARPALASLAAADRNTWSPEAIDTAAAVVGELDALAPEDATAEAVALRLRAMHVLQLVALGDVVSREQRVELMQVSFNAANQLDPDRLPQDKLAGPELGRLGAFLKRSWRANDWMWGRMDGAARLAEVLLDPKRLRQLGRSRADVEQLLHDDFAWTSVGAVGVSAELSFLDDPTLPTPQRLPLTAAVVSRRLQEVIATEELPVIRDAIEVSIRRERANDPDGGRWQRLYDANVDPDLMPQKVAMLVRELNLGRETVGTELGYGLLNRTLSQGAAVAVNALAGDNVGIPGVARLVKPLRTPLHAVNAVVRTATTSSPFGKAFSAFVFALAGAVLAVRLVTGKGTTGMVVVSALLLAGATVAALARTRLWFHAIFFVPLASIITLTLAGDGLTDVLYGDVGRLPGWKRWGFVDEVSVLHWCVLLVGLWLTTGVVEWMRRRWKLPFWPALLLWAVAAAGAALLVFATNAISRWSRDVLSGEERPSGLKHVLARMASNLGGYRLEVVLLAMVVGSILLGTAYDVALKRWWRGIVARLRA